MVKVRLWGEPAELEELIEKICNEFPAVRVLSVSEPCNDRGASVYKRCYIEVALNNFVLEEAAAPKNVSAIVRRTRRK